MPQMKKPRRYITPLVLFTLAGWALWALGRNEPKAATPDADATDRTRAAGSTSVPARTSATWSKRRLATSLAFATLFFGGAAFSAGAGDVVANALEDNQGAEVSSTEEEPSDEPATDEESSNGEQGQDAAEGDPPAEGEDPGDGANGGNEEQPGDPADPPSDGNDGPGDGAEDPGDGGEDPGDGGESPGDGGSGDQGDGDGDGNGTPPPPLPDGDDSDDPAPPDPGVGDGPDSPSSPDDLPVIDKETRSPAQLDPEADADGFFATIWLHRPLPDPTPPAKRLKPAFAAGLARAAAAAKVDWALVLGVLRARGFDSSSMRLDPVRATARQLAARSARYFPRRALRDYGGRDFAEKAFALRNYNRAVGLRSLVDGLEASKSRLQRMVLRDKRLDIYPGGRLDIAMGRTDVRILVLLRYLAEAHGQATVSSLTTGHGLYARPGVISAHVYGLAVDVAALNDTSIYGHQGPGSLTQRAVENILLLPSELQAKQVISLMGLGGPSFPLANHDDHIHVGY
jgi:hypothetical protein